MSPTFTSRDEATIPLASTSEHPAAGDRRVFPPGSGRRVAKKHGGLERSSG
jgi:hypothetical protein